jgi:DNA-binding FadR family transcriptional regulator
VIQQSGPFELIRARRAIEGECAALAAKDGKRAQHDAIAEALDEMRAQAAQRGEPPLDADRQFHLSIAEATNNGALAQVVKTLWDERTAPLFTQLSAHFDTPKSWASAIEEHQGVVDAIRARDADAARAAMHGHLDKAARRFGRSWERK